jgi:hypothetical protein
MIIIEKPMYKGDNNFNGRCIGIAEFRLQGEGRTAEICIKHKRKTGEFVYPSTYLMDVKDIIKYPVEYVGHKKNVKVYVVPIKDLRIKPLIMINKVINCPLNDNKTEVIAVQKGLWE